MYEIKMQGGVMGAVYNCLNSQGQKCEVKFMREANEYYMSFNIDGIWQNKVVGKSGLSSLLWAKKCLLDYIDYMKSRFKCIIIVRASEKRRTAIYKRSLYPLGFKVDRYGNFFLKLKP